MSAVQKRRSSSRVKTQRAAKIAPPRHAPLSPHSGVEKARWIGDILSLVLCVVAIALLLSLASYSHMLLSGREILPTANVMGPTGHIIATLLAGTLGVASLLPVGAIVWLALFRSQRGESDPRPYSAAIICLAFGGLVTGVASLVTLIGEGRFGGTLGEASTTILIKSLGSVGAYLIVALVCAVSAAVVAQRSVGDVGQSLRWVIQTLCKILFLQAPVAALRTVLIALGVLARFLGLGARKVWAVFGARQAQELEPLPRPRVRKNVVAVGVPIGIDDPIVKREFEDVVSVGRADPIIVKPKQADSSAVRKLRHAVPSKGNVERDGAPQGAPAFEGYSTPDVTLLTAEEAQASGEDDEELRQKAEQIEAKLRDFNIAGRVTQVHPGPVITLFEFEPAPGVKVGRIAALQDDLSMSLRASSIRIIAPIPKRGTVGIEVPNKHRAIVRLRECLESEAFVSAESILSIPLGKDTYGDAVVVDIATMPHLLMAGATGTGKSVSINALLLSLLYRAHPSELGLILIDPKVLELSIYDGIPHLRVPVVTDPRQAKAVLSWAVKEMDRRYRYMQKFGVRNIDGYNQLVAGGDPSTANSNQERQQDLPLEMVEEQAVTQPVESVAPEQLKPLPKLVIVIDELADLMLTVGREIEELITRLAQKARAAGIHLILATQRPSVDVITGLIKANFPARLSFRVSSRIDSRTILDSMGAEKLLGKGDMLFMLPGAVPLKRVHGAFVSDQEVQKVVAALKAQCTPQYDQNIIQACEKALAEEGSATGEGGPEGGNEEDFDPFYDKAVELVVEKGSASTSMIQRVFRIGYNRAARIIEMMEREGVVGKTDGVRPREILITSDGGEPSGG